MDKDKILKELIAIISEYDDYSSQNICGETSIKHDLNLDSLDLVNLSLDIERKLGYCIEDSEIKKVNSINDLVNLICEEEMSL